MMYNIKNIITIHNISNKLELDNLMVNCNSIKIITIDYNIINWEDWKLNSINWFDLFFNKI
jgi:hypothetical protein